MNENQNQSMPYTGMPMTGYMNQPGMMQPQWNNFRCKSTLTPEEEREGRQLANPSVSQRPTELELFEGKCNHIGSNGDDMLNIPNPDGSYTCSICRGVVDINKNYTQEDVETIVGEAINICEIIKHCDTQMPELWKREIFGTLIPWLRKIPGFWISTSNGIRKFTQPNLNNTMYAGGNILFNETMNSIPIGMPMQYGQYQYGGGMNQNVQGFGNPIPPMPGQNVGYPNQNQGYPMQGGYPMQNQGMYPNQQGYPNQQQPMNQLFYGDPNINSQNLNGYPNQNQGQQQVNNPGVSSAFNNGYSAPGESAPVVNNGNNNTNVGASQGDSTVKQVGV